MWELSRQFGMPRLPVGQLAEVGFPDICRLVTLHTRLLRKAVIRPFELANRRTSVNRSRLMGSNPKENKKALPLLQILFFLPALAARPAE
jgi:hypothetical protein